MVGVGVLLDLACWRYRKMAKVLFFFECLQLVLEGFVPIDFGQSQAFFVCVQLLLLQVTVGLHSGPNIVASTLLFFVIQFF